MDINLTFQNWDEYQSESKRVKNPSWFRFENKTYMDKIWYELDHQRGEFSALMFLLMFVSQNGNETGSVSTDSRILAQLSGLPEPIIIETLKKLDRLGIATCPEVSGCFPTLPDDSGCFPPTRQDKTIHNKTIQKNAHAAPARASVWKVSEVELEKAYEGYPRKKGKSRALARLKTQIRSPSDLELLGQAIKNFSDYHTREATEAKFIPYFDTFVSEWRDWLEADTCLPESEKKQQDYWAKVWGHGDDAGTLSKTDGALSRDLRGEELPTGESADDLHSAEGGGG